jgi:predicted ATPase
MRLNKLRIVGFQSFADSGELAFADGINLIIGQNNAGKSALLRAIKEISDDRHRTPEAWENVRLPIPKSHVNVTVSGEDLRLFYLSNPGHVIPVPEDADYNHFCDSMFSREKLHLSFMCTPWHWSGSYPGHGLFQSSGVNRYGVQVDAANGTLSYNRSANGNDSIHQAVQFTWTQKLFYFSAERLSLSQSSAAHANRLAPDASNLPSVLLTLNGDRGSIFDKLVEHLRQIFSSVGNISVRPKPENANLIEIRVWPTEDRQRVELSFPLANSGTGVAQVIAILTAVMTTENSVIVIDEINSFLHPAAVKALLRIIQTDYGEHQYIISTHAPEVVSFSNPSMIHLVKRDGYESSVRPLDLKRVEEFREIADNLGVSMSDVFAANHVIWVEGPTEELCFPYLYEDRLGQPLPRATVFTSVSATGDFVSNSRNKKLIFDIYRRLSSAAASLRVGVAFSFDSEGLSARAKSDLRRESDDQVHFLPRRHIECYLISPLALSDFIASKDLYRLENQAALTTEQVAAKLNELAADPALAIPQWTGDLFDEAWTSQVDAAKLIARAVSELTEARVEFRKKNDTLALLQSVKIHSPALIAPLAEYVVDLVNAVTQEGEES